MLFNDSYPYPLVLLTCKCRSRCQSRKKCSCKNSGQSCSISCHPGHSCGNSKHLSSMCIDLTNAKDDGDVVENETLWKNCCGILLKVKHKNMLLSSVEWLDDEVINAVQFLLKQKYPTINGFQSTLLSETITIEPQRGKFVQVLNTRESRWITVSTIGCQPSTINIYNSLNMKLPKIIQKLIADIMQSQYHTIEVKYMNVQKQRNHGNCGILALAFAASLCASQDPTEIAYDECKMKQHLISCITLST